MTPQKALSIIKEANPLYYTQRKGGETVIKPDNEFLEAVKTIEDRLASIDAIEDELGVDLITLFKAISCGCYFKDNGEKVQFAHDVTIGYKRVVIAHEGTKYFMWNVNYGRTWALTKEELL